MRKLPERARAAVRLALTLVIIASVTAVFRLLPVNATTTGFAFLIAVLVIASTWGIREAIVASVSGMLCFNFFFFPPFGTLTIADPQNWVALFTFLVVAIVASQLSASAKRQASTAILKQRELERLYALGRSILLERGDVALPQRLAQSVADSFQLPAVTLYDVFSGCEYKGGPEDLAIPQPILNAALSGDIGARSDTIDSRFALIRLGGRPAGVLGLRGDVRNTTVDAISNLVAIGLERARTQEAENRAEAARQSEELKSTLLDAIAHEFKTPLTSIKAAITSVLGDGALSAGHRDLFRIIDEETDRLTGLVSDAIEISRIEGGNFSLHFSSVDASEFLESVIRQLGSRLQDRTIARETPAGLPPAQLDRELVQLALRQLLDNAVKYSPPASSIRLGADHRDNQIVFWVADEGPGVSGPDRHRVFERYYRASSNRHGVPGTGLGLAVVKQIARAHGGDAVVEAKPGRGTRFEMILPIRPA